MKNKYFTGDETKEELRKKYKKLILKYHPDRGTTEAEKALFSKKTIRIINAYNKLMANEERLKENAAKKEVNKDKIVSNALFDSGDNLGYKELKGKSKEELDEFVNKNFSNISIDSNGKFSKESKAFEDFYKRDFITSVISDQYVHDVRTSMNKFTQKSPVKFTLSQEDMGRFLCLATSMTQSLQNAYKANINKVNERDVTYTNNIINNSNKKLSYLEKSGHTFGLKVNNENGNADKVFYKFDTANQNDINEQDYKFAKDKINSAILESFKDPYNSIDKKQLFYNLITKKDLSYDTKNAKSIFFDKNKKELSDEDISLRTKDLMFAIINNPFPIDGKRVRNRDKFSDLKDLFDANYKASPNSTMLKEIMQQMEKVRIHDNLFMNIRGLTKDFVKQQQQMDDMRVKLGLEPKNEWQKVAEKHHIAVEEPQSVDAKVQEKETRLVPYTREKVNGEFLNKLNNDVVMQNENKKSEIIEPKKEQKIEVKKEDKKTDLKA
jgi:curved DNA-binding protein CbpA